MLIFISHICAGAAWQPSDRLQWWVDIMAGLWPASRPGSRSDEDGGDALSVIVHIKVIKSCGSEMMMHVFVWCRWTLQQLHWGFCCRQKKCLFISLFSFQSFFDVFSSRSVTRIRPPTQPVSHTWRRARKGAAHVTGVFPFAGLAFLMWI